MSQKTTSRLLAINYALAVAHKLIEGSTVEVAEIHLTSIAFYCSLII
jgi:hypothetical protein